MDPARMPSIAGIPAKRFTGMWPYIGYIVPMADNVLISLAKYLCGPLIIHIKTCLDGPKGGGGPGNRPLPAMVLRVPSRFFIIFSFSHVSE